MLNYRGRRTSTVRFIRSGLVVVVVLGSLFVVNGLVAGANETAPEAAEKNPKSDLPAWTEVQNKLSQLEAKIQQKRENIEKLIGEKKHVRADSPRVKEIINNMMSEHRELQTLAIDYEKTMTIFKFRFPERGAKAERNYQPSDIKSLEEMEQQLGLDGKLSRNVKKMRSQYPNKSTDEKVLPSPATNPAPEAVRPQTKEKPIEEAGTIILRK